jgi:autotransporter-associated beta strand protein
MLVSASRHFDASRPEGCQRKGLFMRIGNRSKLAALTPAIVAAACVVSLQSVAEAAPIQKASSGLGLTTGSSWVGGAVPTGADFGLFDSVANASSSGSPYTIPSGNPTWGGITVTDPSAPAFISVGTGTWTLAGNSTANTFIDLSAAQQDLTITGTTANRIIRLSNLATSYAINVAPSRTFTLGSNMVINRQSNNRTLTLTGGGTFAFIGSIQEPVPATAGATSVAVNNSGGVATFSGANTYAGTTTVTAGSLYENGTHTGAGNYTVAANATLAGTGVVTFATNANGATVNGTLAPGSQSNPIGTLSFLTGNVALASAAAFDIDLVSDTSDFVAVGNALTYGGALNVALTGVDTGGASYDLFDFASQSGTFSSINVSGLGAGQTASFDHATGVLSIAVPEPTSLIAVGLAALVATSRRRR